MKFIQLLIFGTCMSLAGCSNNVKLPPDFQKSLDKAIVYINKFNLSHSRLPTRDEYRTWWKTNELVGVADYQLADGNTNEYLLYIWLGERQAIYASKTKTITETDLSR